MLGGSVRRNYRSLVGVLAEDALRQLSADVAFLGASGIGDDLFVMDTTMVEVPIKRGMIAAAEAHGPARRRGQVRDARLGPRLQRRRPRRRRHRRRRPTARRGRRARARPGVEVVHA